VPNPRPLWDGFLSYMVSQAVVEMSGMRCANSPAGPMRSKTSLAAIDFPVRMIRGRHDRPFPLFHRREVARPGFLSPLAVSSLQHRMGAAACVYEW
jgi:hypothetical protein